MFSLQFDLFSLAWRLTMTVKKPPLVFLHGAWTGRWVWKDLMGFFSGYGYDCFAPALCDHETLSPAQIGSLGITDYFAKAYAAITNPEEIHRRPIVIGWSLGGLLAQMLATTGLPRAVILLAPVCPRGICSTSLNVVANFPNYWLRPGFWKKPFMPTFRQASRFFFNGLPKEEQRAEYERLVPESGALAEILFQRPAIAVDPAKVQCPVLIIQAAQDRLIPPQSSEKLMRRYSGDVALRSFNRGHWLLREPGWKKVANCCLKWIQEIESVRVRLPLARVS
jgi:non-heme chloroperoxidase